MSQAPAQFAHRCPDCGAELQGFGDCWLCQRPFVRTQEIEAPPLPREAYYTAPTHSGDNTLLIVSGVASLMVILVGGGIMANDVTMGIVFWLIAVPVLVAITVIAQHPPRAADSAQRGLTTMSAASRFLMGIAIAFGMIGLLIFVAVVVLFVLCLASFR
ncbi:hypothetical protein NA78x_005124 [Anatilimnocola sp. NA78]|uniref:hypothetical protein n=1 Tax=Anatilimnocola sp. NA78 TaxID=3415683 RepID=UPI003CE4A74D